MTISSIVITENPVSAWEQFELTLERDRFENLSIVHRDMGGFYSASFDYIPYDREDAMSMLNSALGRSVRINNSNGQVAWEGFINSVTMDTGLATIQNTLNEMANKVYCRYTPVGGGAVTRSTTYQSALSQARFGIKEDVLSGGEISSSVADQLAENYLNLNFWPSPTLQQIDLGGSLRDLPVVRISCHGYYRTLEWRRYNQTASSGTDTVPSIIQSILTSVGQFIASSSFEGNSTQITKEFDADRKASDICAAAADLGNSEGRLFLVGVEEGRHFYYREAAPPVRTE